ncbi:MAG: hypothetical protein ABIS01_01180 [Ferruginibacter sp.]
MWKWQKIQKCSIEKHAAASAIRTIGYDNPIIENWEAEDDELTYLNNDENARL